jgi:hypothetical protein
LRVQAEWRIACLQHPDPSIKRLAREALADMVDEEAMQRLAIVSMALDDNGAPSGPCDCADSGPSGSEGSTGRTR